MISDTLPLVHLVHFWMIFINSLAQYPPVLIIPSFGLESCSLFRSRLETFD